jgi:hypothetical protein
LISDRIRDLALNGKDIRQVAIVGLRPKMGIVSRIN